MLPGVCSWNVARAGKEAIVELRDDLQRSVILCDQVLLLQECDFLDSGGFATHTFYKGSDARVGIAIPNSISGSVSFASTVDAINNSN